MLFLRWKWIFYHFISSITAVIFSGLVLKTMFPELICLPTSPPVLFAIAVIIFLMSSLSAIIGGFQSTKDIRKQLEEISLGAKNLAYGNLEYRLKLHGNAEFDEISLTFNEMAERIEQQVGALQQLAEENEQLLQDAQVTAVSQERQRIARDLHDAVSQQLFAISMLAATASKVALNKPEQANSLIQEISLSANRAQAEMRALLLQLRPLTLQNESLSQALKSLAMELEGKQTIKCNLDLDELQLPKNIENQLFRIAQEALSNVLRHAEASQVNISLKSSKSRNRILLTIEDDGKGFILDNVHQSSIGMRSIKERSILLGGTAHWVTVLQQGTKVEVRIPLFAEAEKE